MGRQNTADVYEIKPQDFKIEVQVAACYLEIDGHLLLLQCGTSKQEAGKWGVPAGKLETNEFPDEAAKRELFEETGIENRQFLPSPHWNSIFGSL